MKTITTEQFNALPEERRKYWKFEDSPVVHEQHYTPIQINLEDAERVLEEAMPTWIRVEDKNNWPKYGEHFTVLVYGSYTADCPRRAMEVHFRINGNRIEFRSLDGIKTKNVTHWMPLPKSPADNALTTALNNLKQLTK